MRETRKEFQIPVWFTLTGTCHSCRILLSSKVTLFTLTHRCCFHKGLAVWRAFWTLYISSKCFVESWPTSCKNRRTVDLIKYTSFSKCKIQIHHSAWLSQCDLAWVYTDSSKFDSRCLRSIKEESMFPSDNECLYFSLLSPIWMNALYMSERSRGTIVLFYSL